MVETSQSILEILRRKFLRKKKKKIKGFLDGIDGNYVFGWVWDPENPEKRLKVVVYVDGEPVAEGIADQYRGDLEKAGIGDGRYGFRIQLPELNTKADFIEVSVRVKELDYELLGSPRKVNKFFGEYIECNIETEVQSVINFLKSLTPGIELFHIVFNNTLNRLDSQNYTSIKLFYSDKEVEIDTFYMFDKTIVIPFFGAIWETFCRDKNQFVFTIKFSSNTLSYSLSPSEIIRWIEYILINNLKSVSIQKYLKLYLTTFCIESFVNSEIIRREVLRNEKLSYEIFQVIQSFKLFDHEKIFSLIIQELKKVLDLWFSDHKENKYGILLNNYYKNFIKICKSELDISKFFKYKLTKLEENFIKSFLPKLSLDENFNLIFSFLGGLKDKLNYLKENDKYHASLYLIFADDLEEAKDLIYFLSKKDIPGWFSSECIYYFIKKLKKCYLEGHVDIKSTDEVIYAIIHFLDSFNGHDRWYSRVYNKWLIMSCIELLEIIEFLPDWIQNNLIKCIIRNYGLFPEFWRFLPNYIIDSIPDIKKAKKNFEAIEEFFNSTNFQLEDIEKCMRSIEFFLNYKSQDAIYLYRELGYFLLNMCEYEKSKGIFEKLNNFYRGEILRFYAHPLSIEPQTDAEGLEIEKEIRQLIPYVSKNFYCSIEKKFGRALLLNDSKTINKLLLYLINQSYENSYLAWPFALDLGVIEPFRIIDTLLDILNSNSSFIPPSIEACIIRLIEKNFNIAEFIDEKKLEWLKINNTHFFDLKNYNPFFRDTLIVIYSCQKNLNTRISRIRDTYIKDLQSYRIPYIIVVGGSEEDYYSNDILYLNIPDDYLSLPKKTIKMLDWLYRNSPFYYIYKIDDDSYIDIEKFLSLLQYRKFHYFGNPIGKKIVGDRLWHLKHFDKKNFTIDKGYYNISYADGGSGYCLTRYSIYQILKLLETEVGNFIYRTYLYEDMLVGALLNLVGLHVGSCEYYVSKQFKSSHNGIPVQMHRNFFYPSKSNPITYVHLDSEHNIIKAHSIKKSFKLYPHKIWASSVNISFTENSNQLELISERDKLKELIQTEPIVIICVRNEKHILPHFLKHYRDLGIKCFIFIDNLSNDGTKEYLYNQPDVILFSVETEYKKSHYGIVWQHAILSNFCHGKWVLLVDADEFLIYPDCENIKIQEFLKMIEQEYNIVRADLLDVYSRTLDELDIENVSPFEVGLYFDEEPFLPVIWGSGYYSNCNLALSSGLKHRLYKSAPIGDFCATKYPLFKYYPFIRISEGVHFITPLEKVLEGKAVLLHVKYTKFFKQKVILEALRGQHFQGAREYIRYYLGLTAENGKDNFFDPHISLKYEGSIQLIRYIEKLYSEYYRILKNIFKC